MTSSFVSAGIRKHKLFNLLRSKEDLMMRLEQLMRVLVKKNFYIKNMQK